MEYSKIKLSDCCSSISDGDHLPPPKSENGIPFITISNIDRNNQLSFDNVMYVPNSYYENLPDNKKARAGDILYSVVGSFGKPVYVKNDIKFVFQRHIAILRPNKNIDGRYLYYLMLNPLFYQKIDKLAIGCSQRTVTLDTLRNLQISIPNLDTQGKITKVLEKIDHKIELNNSVNDNLQRMAKTIYDYWFTQFDFPDENGKPYCSSGGEMVWNEELKRNIPIGWEVKRLGDLLTKNIDAFDYQSIQPAIDLSVMPSDTISLSQINTSENFATNLFNMKAGDILFGSIRPYLHKAGIAPCDGVVAGTVHSYCVKQSEDYNFSLITMCRSQFFDYAVNISSGTKMPVVSSDALLDYKVAYSHKIAKAFNQIALKQTIIQAVMENQRLTALRDWLLPMLMNGQATIAD